MKKFSRTIAGKTVLFIVCVLSICLLLGSVALAVFMADSDFYTRDKDEVYGSIIYDRVSGDLYKDVWAAVHSDGPGVVALDANDQLEYRIFGPDGEMIAQTPGADNIAEWDYSFVYGAFKNEQGVVSDLFISDVGTDQDLEHYTAKAALRSESGGVGYYSIVWNVVSRTYGLRYWIYLIIVLLALIMITTFVALMSAAGRNNEDDEIHPGPLHRVPFDVLLGLLAGAVIIYILSLDYITYGDVVMVVTVCAGLLLLINMTLGLCMSLAVRIKLHDLIKGSLIFMVLRFLWSVAKWFLGSALKGLRGIGSALSKLPLIWKTVLGICVVCVFELIMFSERYVWFPAWVAEKIVLIPLIIYIALMLRTLQKGGRALAAGELSDVVDTSRMIADFKGHGENLNSVGEGLTLAVEERLKSERMKTELITNVSHDIKTPLTSIINYTDLISREETENEKIHEYSEVLLRQSERLKRLIDDLVEASKASSGNLEVELTPCEASVFVDQAVGEYKDRLEESGLKLVTTVPDREIRIMADGRRMWRIFDNLMNNILKYAQDNTRVYLSLEERDGMALFTFKNTSREQLNISEEELMERFTRGDSSRNTEGNGLGLSIAKSMAALQNGDLRLSIDGDLFKAILSFPTL